jgi:hypothetical protein
MLYKRRSTFNHISLKAYLPDEKTLQVIGRPITKINKPISVGSREVSTMNRFPENLVE